MYVIWKDVEPKKCGFVRPSILVDLYVAQVQEALKQKFGVRSSLFLSQKVKRLTVYTPCDTSTQRVLARTKIECVIDEVPNPHEIPNPTIAWE